MSEELPHIASLRRQDKLNRISASHRFRVAGGKFEKYRGDLPAAGLVETALKAEARERFANPQVGDSDERGVFLGVWKPTDGDGNSLSRLFNVFAAPEDLFWTRTYVDTVEHIAGLRDWHGHDGASYATDKELYEAIKNDSYNGGWIIPTKDILYGKDDSDVVMNVDSLSAHQDKGAFRGTYKDNIHNEETLEYPGWYWSSTEPAGLLGSVWVFRMTENYHSCIGKNGGRASCRPVRLEPKP